MKKLLFAFCVASLVVSCSQDDNSDGGNATTLPEEYVNVKFDGTEINFLKDSTDRQAAYLQVAGDVYRLVMSSGYNPSAEQSMVFEILFDKNGNFLTANQRFNEEVGTGFSEYYNYPDFPAYFFHLDVVSNDEVNKKMKLNFSGRIFHVSNDMDSESKEISGEANITYTQATFSPITFLSGNNLEQYCRATMNGEPWRAWFERTSSAFTTFDPYKVEIHFSDDATPGSYNFTNTSADNYIRFSKFNPATLTYELYETSGVVAHSYKEWMGGTNYNFIGTFNFTAVNPSNPSDVIHMDSGEFRSYQHY